MRRVIRQRIENPLAGHLLAGDFGEGDTIRVGVNPSKHDFSFEKRAEPVDAELVGA